MLKMIELIALRKGFGDVLAEGVARASKKLGKATEQYAIHVKGLEVPMHEPRLKQGLGVGYAVSPTRADHCHNIHDTLYSTQNNYLAELQSLNTFTPLPLTDLSAKKVSMLTYYSNWMHFLNCAVCCYFIISLSRVGFERTAQLVRAVTGWNTSVAEILQVGERAATMGRLFNLREGFTAKDDTLPERFFGGMTEGPLKDVPVNKAAFKKAVAYYYDIMSWPGGVPTEGMLGELGLDWVDSDTHC